MKFLLCLLPAALLLPPGLAQDHPGKAIYAQHCASCHGENGEGNPDEVGDPLQGRRSLKSLTRYIVRNMPDEDPDEITDEESAQVAEYIYHAFYSAEARAKSGSVPERAFAHLTNRQFRESVADLLGSFRKTTPPGEGKGLTGRYFSSDGMNKKAKFGFERVDTTLEFHFGEAAPAEELRADQFSIAWDGSLLPVETGWHEFRLTTPNGARLYLNGDAEAGDSNARDDSGAKRQIAFIDSWVSSGSEDRVATERLFLLGGRAYPMRLDYFKYLDKEGRVKLEWKRPGAGWEVLATPYLSPARAAHVPVLGTAFPPDDSVEGYERGTTVSKEWAEAAARAATDTANMVLERLPLLSGVRDGDPEAPAKLRAFIATLAERAFRRPLDDEQRAKHVDAHFADESDLPKAVKRAVVQIILSPRFLYPDLGPADDYQAAARLALNAWDSLPDQALLEAAREGALHTPEQIRAHAERAMNDPRARAKVALFFRRWLKMDMENELTKSPDIFPGFDAQMVDDLKRSLEMFLSGVVWSEESDYRQLLLADYLFLNERLARYYGAPVPEGSGFQPVKFEADQRAGVLTHPYVLSRLAYIDNTSPIHRGVFTIRNILGGVLKPPPSDTPFENDKFDPQMTMREKVTQITGNKSCLVCHNAINPLGFAYENFDGTGHWRSAERSGRPLDTVSKYDTLDGETIQVSSPRDIAQYAANSPSAHQGFIRQLLQHQLKQNPMVYGFDTVPDLARPFTENNYNIRRLLVDIQTLGARPGSAANPEQARR